MALEDKIKDAEVTLKLAAEMSAYYYNKPLIVCYSGGKDSDVLLDIAKNCLKPADFEVLNSHTTVDAPETVYHIRDVFKECEAQGIKTEIRLPRDKDGKLISMWSLVEKKKMPPTRIVRYCCQYLKETSTPNRMIALGVREDESAGRAGREAFGVRPTRKTDNEYRTTSHTFAMFRIDQTGKEGAYECEMIKACKKNKDTICNPIYRFTESDIWQYIHAQNLTINPLYSRGYKRVGCVGCPLGGANNMRREFADYPKYKLNYIRAFDRMLKARIANGLPSGEWRNGEDVFKWWLGENPKQVTFDDILNEEAIND